MINKRRGLIIIFDVRFIVNWRIKLLDITKIICSHYYHILFCLIYVSRISYSHITIGIYNHPILYVIFCLILKIKKFKHSKLNSNVYWSYTWINKNVININ